MTAVQRPSLQLLGAPQLLSTAGVTTWGAERRCQLLALLALRAGQWVSRDEVASLLWPLHGASEARRNLRKVIFRAGAMPGTEALQATPHALRWDIDTDLQALRDVLLQGDLRAVLDADQGQLMQGLDDDDNPALRDWLASERERWHAAWHRAALAALQRCDSMALRVQGAGHLLARDALDEEALLHLMRAHQAQGHAAAAQAAYRRYAERLAEVLGVEPSRELRLLAQPEVRVSLPPGDALTAPENGPDGAAIAFVGRRVELAGITRALAGPGGRWLTLLGPGGIGKSSLARRAMALMEPTWPGRCLWIDLQDLDSVAAVVERLAHRLGVQVGSADPLAPLLARLGPGPALWVLDNAEHLAAPPASLGPWLQALRGRAPALHVLVTSRARLHGAGETPHFVRGLPVPDEDSRDPEAAQSFDAVRLFDLRARAALPGFKLRHHLAAVVDIVEQVDGLPLAIELAAGWVRVLPPEEIARDLRLSSDVLERDRRAAGQPARPEHDSLRGVVAGTWDLLAPRERAVLAALSVCRGGATLALARAVTQANLPLLSSLVDRSMLAADEAGRFSLHPIVQTHAEERLGELGDAGDEARRRHAAHMAQVLGSLAPHARGDVRLLIDGVSAERANIDAAWSLALREQRFDLLHAMVRALWSYFEHRSLIAEGIAMLQPALALPAASPVARRFQQRLRHGLSMLHHRRGQHAQGLTLAESGVALGDLGELEPWLGCLLNAGSCEWEGGRVDLAHARFEQALRLAGERQDRYCEAWALGNLGVAWYEMGRLDESVQALRRALVIHRELGCHYQVTVHLNNLGALHRLRGEWAHALAVSQEGLRLAEEHRLETAAVLFRLKLGAIHEGQGELGPARTWFEQVMRQARDTGLGTLRMSAEIALARVEVLLGQDALALRRLNELAYLAQAQDSPLDEVRVVAVYALWLSRCGRPAEAVRAWRVAAASHHTQPLERAAWLSQAQALADPADEQPIWDNVAGLLAALAADSAAAGGVSVDLLR